MTGLVALLARARDAGLTLDSDGNRLTVRGDRRHATLVRAILARKAEALTLIDLYNGRTAGLDWRHTTVAEKPGRCVLCRRWALLRDPFDNQPMHKTCAENTIRPRSETRNAA